MAQSKLEIGSKYLKLNGKSTFINGANYIPSKGWLQILDNWNAKAVEQDMDSLHGIGVDFIRFMPLWYLTQPEKNKFDQQKIDRLNELINIAGKRGIKVQPSLITGYVSGGLFSPAWIDKKMFIDPSQIDGEVQMIRTITKSLSGNPYVHSYDFGNELNALRGVAGCNVSPDQIKTWMPTIYNAFKEGDPSRLVTNGIGTGYDQFFPIENIAPACDYMSAHSYPYFHNTILDDQWFGLRTTYSTNLIIAWAKMTGKPVIMQETGISNTWMNQRLRAKYLEMSYFSCWADGAAGFVWWCSHDIDSTFRVKPAKDGRPFLPNGKFDPLEYEMGLLDVNNNKYPAGQTFKQCVEFSTKLGLDWDDQMPVCYIVAPETASFNDYFRRIINAYVLAKQNHVDVRFLHQGSEVPADASFVIVPGFSIGTENRIYINKYLTNGGKVYQSFYNDFAPDIYVSTDISSNLEHPVQLTIQKHIADLNQLEKFQLAGHIKRAEVSSYSWNYESLLTVCHECSNHSISQKGEISLYKTKIGKGIFYYTPLNVEESLCDTYSPWQDDESYKFYSVLKPTSDIEIDSKFIEFFHKKNDNKEMIILINHSYSFQPANLLSKQTIQLQNWKTGKAIGEGKDFNISLSPAEVMFLEVVKKN
jgi:hypothetical protein